MLFRTLKNQFFGEKNRKMSAIIPYNVLMQYFSTKYNNLHLECNILLISLPLIISKYVPIMLNTGLER